MIIKSDRIIGKIKAILVKVCDKELEPLGKRGINGQAFLC